MSHGDAGNSNGPTPRREPPPNVPIKHVYANCVIHFVPRDEGAIELVFTPAIPVGPGQFNALTPQLVIPFSKDGWEQFKRDVDRDGVQSGIIRAQGIPKGPLG